MFQKLGTCLQVHHDTCALSPAHDLQNETIVLKYRGFENDIYNSFNKCVTTFILTKNHV